MQELLHTCEVQCMYVLHSAMLNTMHAPTLIVAYTIYALCCQYYVCTYTNSYYINPYFMCLYSYCSRSWFHVVQKSIPRIFINHIKRFYHHFNPPILQRLAAPLERALNKYPEVPMIPQSACKISTPLNTQNWHQYLLGHPDQELVSYFLEGISAGFRIGLSTPAHSLHSAHRNLRAALLHPQIVDGYLQTELSLGRISGPFLKSQCSTVQISRFGVIPKRHQPNKWRLIVDLSHPPGYCVNDCIPKALCSLIYITVDHAIYSIVQSGPNTLLAKIDIKSAFRLIPVHPADRHLLAMRWRDKSYIDGCLPFGLRSAPKLFNILADLLSWIASQR